MKSRRAKKRYGSVQVTRVRRSSGSQVTAQTATLSSNEWLTSIHASSRVSPWRVSIVSTPSHRVHPLSTQQRSRNISPTLPQSFYSSSSTQLVTNRRKEEKRKKTRRRLPPLAIIACILICALLCMAIAAIITYVLTVALATKTVQTTASTSAITVAGSSSTVNTTITIINTTVTTIDTTTTINSTDASTSTTAGLTPSWNATGVTVVNAIFSIALNGLNNPYGLALDSTASNVYITDQYNNRVQKWPISASAGVTVAGQSNAVAGATASYLNVPCGIVLDPTGGLYLADSNNNRVQYWANGASSGTTFAGTGVAGSGTDQLNSPKGISLDSNSGILYIADSTNNRVMTSNGTVAAGGNGGGNTRTQLLNPRGVYFDSTSNSLIIANYGGHNVVRWVLGATNWTLLAGSATGSPGATSTTLNYPTDAILDSYGNLYVADTYNDRIQFYAPGQTNGTTIAGVTNTIGSTATLLHYPFSMRLDSQLNLYVLDSYNQRVQKFARL